MKTSRRDIDRYLRSTFFAPTVTERQLGKSYHDQFATAEQKERDHQITQLLTQYVSFYKSKVFHSTICRYVILIPCMLIVSIFAGLLFYLSLHILKLQKTLYLSDIIAFVTACVSFISLIIGLLTIITKYFFPENDEQYVAAIVESIQKNDLKNKRENAKNRAKDLSAFEKKDSFEMNDTPALKYTEEERAPSCEHKS